MIWISICTPCCMSFRFFHITYKWTINNYNALFYSMSHDGTILCFRIRIWSSMPTIIYWNKKFKCLNFNLAYDKEAICIKTCLISTQNTSLASACLANSKIMQFTPMPSKVTIIALVLVYFALFCAFHCLWFELVNAKHEDIRVIPCQVVQNLKSAPLHRLGFWCNLAKFIIIFEILT